MHVADQPRFYQIRIFYLKRLLPASVFLENFNQQYLIIGNGKLVQKEYVLFGFFTANYAQRLVASKRSDRSFLYHGTFGHFLIHHLEINKINLERNIRAVCQFGVEIVFTVMDVNSFENKLNAK